MAKVTSSRTRDKSKTYLMDSKCPRIRVEIKGLSLCPIAETSQTVKGAAIAGSSTQMAVAHNQSSYKAIHRDPKEYQKSSRIAIVCSSKAAATESSVNSFT